MYTLRSEFPPTVLVFLNELNLRAQTPAWMMVTGDGLLADWGGDTALYGIGDLQKGQPATAQLRFLAGLLPVDEEPLALPLVETDSGVYADIHIWHAFGRTWVLLIDATAQALESRRLQQRSNEFRLDSLHEQRNSTRHLINQLFTALGIVALEFTTEPIKPLTDLPEWFERLLPAGAGPPLRSALEDRFPFIANFLIDADQFWRDRKPGRLRSGIWIETDATGRDCRLEASAINIDGMRLLLIEAVSVMDDEMESILQKARENILDYQRLARTEAALRRSEARNRALLEAIPDLILRTNHAGEIIDYSARPDRPTALAPENLIGRHVTELLSPSAEPLVRQCLAECRRSGATQSVEYESHDNGNQVYFEVRFSHCGDDELLTIIRDVTERRLAQEAELIRRSEEYFRALIENSSDIIIVVNADASIRYESPAMRRILGYGPAEPVGQSAFDLIHPDDQPTVLKRQRQLSLMSPDQLVNLELRLRHKDGSWRLMEAAGRNLLSHDRINGLVLTLHDVTEKRAAAIEQARLQASLRRSETMAAMGSLVAGVAHEVRNPLFSLSATLDAFAARFEKEPGHQRYISVLRGEIDRLNRLMQDLLDYGRPAQPDLQPVSLAEVIDQAIEHSSKLARQSSVTISSEPALAVTLPADRQRLGQVFRNLIENAIQHSPAGGTVTITVRPEDEMITCRVSDEGPGFDPQQTEKVFEPFFSQRRGGTGLGLSIVRRIVEEHGGEVLAENDEAGGAIVTLRLPVTQ